LEFYQGTWEAVGDLAGDKGDGQCDVDAGDRCRTVSMLRDAVTRTRRNITGPVVSHRLKVAIRIERADRCCTSMVRAKSHSVRGPKKGGSTLAVRWLVGGTHNDAVKDAGMSVQWRCWRYSRDAESIPSDLSDFNRYGGLSGMCNWFNTPASR